MIWNYEGREMSFINKSSLSDEQKTQLETIINDQQQKMQDIMQSSRSWSWVSEAELETVWKENMAQIRPFVAQDQLTEFDKFVAEWKPQMLNFGNRWRRMR